MDSIEASSSAPVAHGDRERPHTAIIRPASGATFPTIRMGTPRSRD